MIKKINLSFLLSILVIIVLISVPVLAVSDGDLKDINSQIKDKKSQLEDVGTEKDSLLKEVSKIASDISSYEKKIDDLKNDIKNLENNIEKMKQEIIEKEEIYKENYEKMVTRIVTTYENGNTTYLDVLLSSKSFSELNSNWYYLSVITEADKSFLETIQKAKTEIEQRKSQLETDKQKIEANKKDIEQTSNKLKAAKTEKQGKIVNLSDEQKELQKELEQFEKDKRSIEAELRRIAEESKNNNVINSKPSEHGYIFPVAGLNRNSINNKSYPSYSGHTGTDVNINVVGKSVVAVKSGTVVISTALTGSISNYGTNGTYVGGYRSYGEYIVIDHHDGTMTLYAHLKAGSRAVSVGQQVKQGQVIGVVGNTGNCMPRPTASNPLNGTHLHFEVRINGSPVNPVPYLP